MSAIPELSIGLPVYNGESFLAESLDALLGQTYEDFELIISDNASTDGTPDICHRYEKKDSRIRYIRQPRNIGAAPNHNFLVQQARGELFKWASADDLYARDLIRSCVYALDEYPKVVLAHSWTAAVDDKGNVTQALDYPLATDSARAPERFRSVLFGCSGLYESGDGGGNRAVPQDNNGVIRADDMYGVIRTNALRRVAPHGSYYHADRILVLELALNGPFHQTADWLYFRRDHDDRGTHSPTVRTWCGWLDPDRSNPGCGTRPPGCWPSTSGATSRRSGGRRSHRLTGYSATVTWHGGSRTGQRAGFCPSRPRGPKASFRPFSATALSRPAPSSPAREAALHDRPRPHRRAPAVRRYPGRPIRDSSARET